MTADAVRSSPIVITLMMEAIRSQKRQFLQEPRGVTSQKTSLFILKYRDYAQVNGSA
jgi:hypothetical protein